MKGEDLTAPADKAVLWQRRICISLLYTSVLLSSFAVSFGSKQLPIAWLVGLVHFGALALLTRGRFDFVRLFAVAVALSLATFETAACHSLFSATSLIYIALIYAPLALTAPLLGADIFRTVWWHVSIVAAIITVCGLIQLAGQFVAGGLFIDPIHQLPSSLLLDGYNTTYPIAWGQQLLKPNGMFLLEPSFFSQIIALGLLSEMVFFQRKGLMILFVVGLGASFSGTGLLMVLPALLFIGSARMIFGFAALALLLAGAIFALGYGDIYMARATETGDSNSSGSMRFVTPYQEMWDGWEGKTSDFLFGKGAGVSQHMSTGADANFGPVSKVGVEYGVLGLAAFTAVWLTLFWGLALPRALTVALIIFYFLGSGSFLQPFSVFMMWPLTAGFLRAQRDDLIAVRAVESFSVPKLPRSTSVRAVAPSFHHS
jgi:hypothetical protein